MPAWGLLMLGVFIFASAGVFMCRHPA
jgi:hypothetical protein